MTNHAHLSRKATFISAFAAIMTGCAPPSPGQVDAGAPESLVDDAANAAAALPAPNAVVSPVVPAPRFASTSRQFVAYGDQRNVYVTPPPLPTTFPFQVPVVQIRSIVGGDVDLGYWWGATRTGDTHEFHGELFDAPRVSHGVENKVTGVVTVLGLDTTFGFSNTFRRAANGQTVRWPPFVALNPSTTKTAYFNWAMQPCGDDDAEATAYTESGSHALRVFGGNGCSSATVQALQLQPPAGVRVTEREFSVASGEPIRTYRIARTPGKPFVVLAGAHSQLSCGADDLSFQLLCSDTATDSACTVRVWNGAPCSRISGSMMVIESD